MSRRFLCWRSFVLQSSCSVSQQSKLSLHSRSSFAAPHRLRMTLPAKTLCPWRFFSHAGLDAASARAQLASTAARQLERARGCKSPAMIHATLLESFVRMSRERLKLVSNCRKWSPTPLPTSLRSRKRGSSTSCRAAVAYGLIPCGWEATLWTTTCTGIPTSTTEAWRTGGLYSTACVRQSCLPSTFYVSGRGWWRCFPARSKPCVQHLGTIENGIEIEI